MKNVLNVILVVVCVSLLNGCAMFMTRSTSDNKWPLANDMCYQASRADLVMWCIVCTSDKNDRYFTADYSKAYQYFLTPIVTVLCLGDGLISVTTDTVLLPYDYLAN